MSSKIGFKKVAKPVTLEISRKVQAGKETETKEALQAISNGLTLHELHLLLKVVNDPQMKVMALNYAQNL